MMESASPKNTTTSNGNIGAFLQKYGIYLFLALMIIVAGIISPAFLSLSNWRNLMTAAGPLGMVALGQLFVILTGGLDLSVGSLMSTTAVVATAFHAGNIWMVPIFVFSMILGVLVGWINGYLITKRRVSPFLVTLAMWFILDGIRLAYTRGMPMSGHMPSGFRVIGSQHVLGIPYSTLALLILVTIFGLLLYRMAFGRQIYLVGSNAQAGFMAGIKSDRVIIWAYIICSLLASIAGLFLVGFTGSVDNFMGKEYTLDSIAAVVIGGALLTGGKGGIFGAMAGVMLLTVTVNMVLVIGMPVQTQFVVRGIIIILAVSFYQK